VLERLTRTERRWVVAGVVAVFLAIVGFVGVGPWHGARMLDLDVYRMGGSALLHGRPIYDQVEPTAVLYFTYPIFAAMLFAPFAALPLVAAKVLMLLLSLAGLFVIVRITVQHVAGRAPLSWTIPLSILGVAVHPVFETLTFAQVNLVLVALVLIDLLMLGRSRGVLVGLATGVKLVPGIFILYFLVTGQRRAALTATLTTLGTAVLGFLVQPGQAWAFWTNYALNPDRTGGVSYVTNQSFLGVSSRLLRDPHPPRALALSLGAVAVVLALWAARRLYRTDEFTAICGVAVAGLLFSPISWSHHWVWAIPCLGTVIVWARSAGGGWRWWLFGIVAAIVASGPMQFMPKEQLRELHHTHPQQLVANIFCLLGVVYLGWVGLRAARISTPAPRLPAQVAA
jgi:alpha-1,2-mannosyltransferase